MAAFRVFMSSTFADMQQERDDCHTKVRRLVLVVVGLVVSGLLMVFAHVMLVLCTLINSRQADNGLRC